MASPARVAALLQFLLATTGASPLMTPGLTGERISSTGGPPDIVNNQSPLPDSEGKIIKLYHIEDALPISVDHETSSSLPEINLKSSRLREINRTYNQREHEDYKPIENSKAIIETNTDFNDTEIENNKENVDGSVVNDSNDQELSSLRQFKTSKDHPKNDNKFGQDKKKTSTPSNPRSKDHRKFYGSSTESNLPQIVISNFLKESSSPRVPCKHCKVEDPVIAVWKDFEKMVRRVVELAIRQALPIFLRSNMTGVSLSGPCTSSLFRLVFGIRHIKTWAFQFLDATGKLTPGLMTGSLSSLGDFDQCMAARVPKIGEPTKTDFRGQYCTVKARPPLPPKPRYYAHRGVLPELLNFSTGGNTVLRELAKDAQVFYFGLNIRYDICVPSTCSRDDLSHILTSVVEYTDLDWELELGNCQMRPDHIEKAHWSQHATMSVLAMLLSFVFLSSLLEMARDTFHPSPLASVLESTAIFKVLMAFSLPRNLVALFDTHLTFPRFRALHGLRFLTMTWVVLVSTYQSFNPHLFSNVLSVERIRGFLMQPVFNATLSLDSFFFLSGLMVTYLTLITIQQKEGVLSFKRQLWKRYLRVTPPYVLFMALCYLVTWEGGGSMWPEIAGPIVANCNRHWWLNFLYISNWVLAPKDYCIPPSYYFSCDMQLYVVGITTAYLLYRSPKVGKIVLGALVAASVLANVLVTYFMEFPPTLVLSYPDRELMGDYNRILLFQSYSHLGPYSIGAAVGYFLYVQPEYRFSLVQQAAGWGFAGLVGSLVLYGTYEWNTRGGHLPQLGETLLYAGLHRTCWALTLAWVSAVCVLGQGGLANRFLSWPVMVPFSRLTYMAFLFQWLLRTLMLATLRERIAVDHFTAAFLFVGLLTSVYLVSFAFTLILDLPVISLRRLVLNAGEYEASKLHPRRPVLHRLTSNL